MRTHLITLALGSLLVITAAAAEPTTSEAKAAMSKATKFIRSIATEGGYLWRYSEDLQFRAGEDKATATQIWIQPPGTPAMGEVFLRAYAATKEAEYLAAAQAVATALARGQLESGGWDYSIDFAPDKFPSLTAVRMPGSSPPRKRPSGRTFPRMMITTRRMPCASCWRMSR